MAYVFSLFLFSFLSKLLLSLDLFLTFGLLAVEGKKPLVLWHFVLEEHYLIIIYWQVSLKDGRKYRQKAYAQASM